MGYALWHIKFFFCFVWFKFWLLLLSSIHVIAVTQTRHSSSQKPGFSMFSNISFLISLAAIIPFWLIFLFSWVFINRSCSSYSNASLWFLMNVFLSRSFSFLISSLLTFSLWNRHRYHYRSFCNWKQFYSRLRTFLIGASCIFTIIIEKLSKQVIKQSFLQSRQFLVTEKKNWLFESIPKNLRVIFSFTIWRKISRTSKTILLNLITKKLTIFSFFIL